MQSYLQAGAASNLSSPTSVNCPSRRSCSANFRCNTHRKHCKSMELYKSRSGKPGCPIWLYPGSLWEPPGEPRGPSGPQEAEIVADQSHYRGAPAFGGCDSGRPLVGVWGWRSPRSQGFLVSATGEYARYRSVGLGRTRSFHSWGREPQGPLGSNVSASHIVRPGPSWTRVSQL